MTLSVYLHACPQLRAGVFLLGPGRRRVPAPEPAGRPAPADPVRPPSARSAAGCIRCPDGPAFPGWGRRCPGRSGSPAGPQSSPPPSFPRSAADVARSEAAPPARRQTTLRGRSAACKRRWAPPPTAPVPAPKGTAPPAKGPRLPPPDPAPAAAKLPGCPPRTAGGWPSGPA